MLHVDLSRRHWHCFRVRDKVLYGFYTIFRKVLGNMCVYRGARAGAETTTCYGHIHRPTLVKGGGVWTSRLRESLNDVYNSYRSEISSEGTPTYYSLIP